jgi:hypothetical protein
VLFRWLPKENLNLHQKEQTKNINIFQSEAAIIGGGKGKGRGKKKAEEPEDDSWNWEEKRQETVNILFR